MLPERQVLSEETCPVSEELLGALYRSSQHGLSELVTSVGPETRAMLALYCYRRAHLQNIGLAIAATCEEGDLDLLGAAGAVLFSRSREAPPKLIATHHEARRTITLATGSLQKFPQEFSQDLTD
jgi:hypothetical protein